MALKHKTLIALEEGQGPFRAFAGISTHERWAQVPNRPSPPFPPGNPPALIWGFTDSGANLIEVHQLEEFDGFVPAWVMEESIGGHSFQALGSSETLFSGLGKVGDPSSFLHFKSWSPTSKVVLASDYLLSGVHPSLRGGIMLARPQANHIEILAPAALAILPSWDLPKAKDISQTLEENPATVEVDMA